MRLKPPGLMRLDGDNGLDLSIYGRAYEYIYTKHDETDLHREKPAAAEYVSGL